MKLDLTPEEASAVHHALYMRLQQLSMIEDHNPDPSRRAQAQRDAAPVIRAADRLLALMESIEGRT